MRVVQFRKGERLSLHKSSHMDEDCAERNFLKLNYELKTEYENMRAGRRGIPLSKKKIISNLADKHA